MDVMIVRPLPAFPQALTAVELMRIVFTTAAGRDGPGLLSAQDKTQQAAATTFRFPCDLHLLRQLCSQAQQGLCMGC